MYAAQFALAANVIALVTTSSPGPTPAANAAAWSAAGSRGKRDRMRHLADLGKGAFELDDRWPLCQPVPPEHLDDCTNIALVERLASVGNRHRRLVCRLLRVGHDGHDTLGEPSPGTV